MNAPIKLRTPTMPRMLGQLVHTTQFLKIFSLLALMVILLCMILISFLTSKKPTVLTLAPSGGKLEQVRTPEPQEQIAEGIKLYLKSRYQWKPVDVERKIKYSENFILPHYLKTFQKSTSAVVRFSKERDVSQKLYPGEIKVNLAKGTAAITGDRITSIQGLKAAGDLKLELSFESGLRTKENPWGVYISKEKEE